MNSIVLLCHFFGPAPWYLPCFLHTCRYNPTIDFVVFTDNDPDQELPPNVSFEKKSLQQFREMAVEAMGHFVQVEPYPYKVCDLRPAFGIICSQYTRGYDFWGYSDLDMVYGDLRSFLTEELLANHELICLRHDYMSGWFTLYRNSTEMNNLFKQSRDYYKVLTTDRYYNFDETNFTFFEFHHNIPYHLVQSEVQSMTHLVKSLQERRAIRAYFDMHAIEGKPGKMKWENGKLIYKGRMEVIMYHLLEFKKVFSPKRFRKKLPEKFFISESRLYF